MTMLIRSGVLTVRKSSSIVGMMALGMMLSIQTAQAQIVRKVLIIGVDGMRPDAMLS